MPFSWKSEAGQLTCHLGDAALHEPYRPEWMQEDSNVPSGYLPPIPDFTSHSPFGGVAWFQPSPRDCRQI